MISLSNSSRLPASTDPMVVNPVMFPPGRGRLSTRPAAIGSVTSIKTIGIVLVAFLAATAAGVLGAMIKSTLRRTSSSAKAESRSSLPSAYRYSKTMFLPST